VPHVGADREQQAERVWIEAPRDTLARKTSGRQREVL